MSDIQRFKAALITGTHKNENPEKLLRCNDGEWVKHSDHLKVIEAKDKVIDNLKETIHLLKSSANNERLNKSIKAIKDGETFERGLSE